MFDGAYDGVKLKCASQAILSDNELDNNGYSVPLEVKPSGQFEPLYKTTLNVQVCLFSCLLILNWVYGCSIHAQNFFLIWP